MRKILPILLVCMLLLAACGSDSTPPKDWEQNPISDFDYEYDSKLQGVAVSYKGESETVWIPTEINGDPVVSIQYIENPKVVKEVYIPDGIVEIGSHAFARCVNLKSVIVPDGVTTIGYSAFLECRNLSSVSLPDSITHIEGDAFWKCDSLTSLKLPSNLKFIGSRSFMGVPLTEIILPEGLEIIDSLAFSNCDEVTSIVIPSSVTKIEQFAFSGNAKLAEITLANPDALIDIGYQAFEGNYWYSKHPDGTKTIASRIAEEIYDTPSIENVTEIVLPEELKHIGGIAFDNAISLITVNIPDSVEYIGDNAFGQSDSLGAASKERIRQINPDAL